MEGIEPQQREKITHCLEASKHCTIATNGTGGWPESATVGFASDGLELVFATWKWTRKYENLQRDRKASFVIGFESGVNVQFEGEAESIDKDHHMVALYLQKKPSAQHYMDDDEYVFFKVIPTWVRYSDFRVNPNEKFEISFSAQ